MNLDISLTFVMEEGKRTFYDLIASDCRTWRLQRKQMKYATAESKHKLDSLRCLQTFCANTRTSDGLSFPHGDKSRSSVWYVT